MSDEKVQIYLCEQDSTAMFFPKTWGKLDKWACFDLDWTLAFPMKSLYHHPADDIHLLPGRKEKLLSLYFNHHLVIFTNQLAKRKERANIITSSHRLPIRGCETGFTPRPTTSREPTRHLSTSTGKPPAWLRSAVPME